MKKNALLQDRWSAALVTGIAVGIGLSHAAPPAGSAGAATALFAAPEPTLFQSPPREARAGSWLFWLGGNVSENGINDTLAGVRATGLASVVMMQVSTFGGPEGPVKVLSGEWWKLLDHYFAEAKRQQLDVVLFASPAGWSMMGDATVKPAESSKRLTSVEVVVEGGGPQIIRLPSPYSALKVYEDLAVVVFPEPEGTALPRPVAAGGPAGFDWSRVLDDDWRTGVVLPAAATALELSYPEPVTVRTLRFWMATWRDRPSAVRVDAEVGPGRWREIGTLDTYWPHGPQDVPLVCRLESTTARRFRITFVGGQGSEVRGVELSGLPRVDLFSPKAGYTQRKEHGGGADLLRASAERWAVADNAAGLAASQILDLTARLQADGTLQWEVPPGRWRILRVGWTTQGHATAPSPPGVRNYIIDPTAAGAVERYWRGYPTKVLTQHGPKNQGAVRALEFDSWEAGNLNWSPNLAAEFARRRGYPLTTYWPVLVGGYLVGDALESERFLRDFRLTLAELISENYYGETARVTQGAGIAFWSEAIGRQQFLYHPTEYTRHADVPMGEFWVNDDFARADCRAASSVAHFYGRPMVAGESFTSMNEKATYDFVPADYKRLGDEALAEGINHFHLHMNALNPYRGPGPGMNARWIGQEFNAGNTWWGAPARGWTDYLARCQYLLRQGRNVADLLYFAGEDFPAELPDRKEIKPGVPLGCEYDACGPTELLQHVRVEADGSLVSPGGARYRLLVLRDWSTMTPAIARRIEELVEAGATIVGPPPRRAAGLTDLATSEKAIRQVRDRLWGTAGAAEAGVDRRVGRGRVIHQRTYEEIFASLGQPFDFMPSPGRKFRYRHRTGEGFDLYFVSNQEAAPYAGTLGFRVTGRQPEIWDPISGRTREAVRWTEAGGLSQVRVDLGPYGSTFVVFRRPGQPAGDATKDSPSTAAPPIAWAGSWHVRFPAGCGAPESIVLPQLISLHTHGDPGVKHFSGTASYQTTFTVPAGHPALGRGWQLELGTVHGIAEVTLNGQALGNRWCPPYRLELDRGAVRPGENTLAIAVTGTWRNRMIGDEEHPRDFKVAERPVYDCVAEWPEWYVQGRPRPVPERIGFSTTQFYQRGDPLQPSGLIGPVKLAEAAGAAPERPPSARPTR